MATPLTTTLGPSELVGTYVDGSEAWHQQRATGIGGSEVASVAQVPGAFKSRWMLWLEKHGDIEPAELSPRLRRLFAAGHALEPLVADDFSEQHPELEVVTTGSWRRVDLPWALSNPDRLLVHRETGEVRLLEIKTSGRGAGFENGFPPDKYVAQVRWYAGNLGIEVSYIALLVGLGDYFEWEIPTDPLLPITNVATGDTDWCMHVSYPNLLRAATEFVDSLRRGEAPPLDGGADTFEYVRAQHPEIDPDGSVELPLELARQLHWSNELAKFWDGEFRIAKTHVLAYMANAKIAHVDGVKVAYRQATGRNTPTLYLSRAQAVRELLGEPQTA